MTILDDILIIGGGIIGLSIAVELRRRGATVTVLSQDFKQAAAHAAGGMLAPQAEAIPAGPLLDLCLRSRSLYADWVAKLEALTGLQTQYWPCGILAPRYETNPSRVEPTDLTSAQWLDQAAIQAFQPGLGPEVVGGWWYPADAQVDNRLLTHTLWAAACELGVVIHEGVTVESIQTSEGRVTGLMTSAGAWQAGHYIVAAGAWAQKLLPLPVYPIKGQMLAVQVPDSFAELPLQRVLFGPETYIIPRRDRRIVIGATTESVGFQAGNTPSGMKSLLTRAIRLFPVLADWPIPEFWWGFRPATPDEAPILGASDWENLTLAIGHYRNGVLLAPITAALIADAVCDQEIDPLLTDFHFSRFLQQ